jgi:putative transposase
MQSSLLSFPTPVYPGAHNEHRPHRSLGQRPPLTQPPPADERGQGEIFTLDRLRRRDRLGGLIHEYELAA